MRTDHEVQQAVLEELQWEPTVQSSHIGVTADHGVVTLTGHAANYVTKLQAERAAKRVIGVEAVANDIDVMQLDVGVPDDASIAQRVLSALDWNVSVPKGRVRVTVAAGWITLEGEVEWFYQKRAAEDAVRDLLGVRGITNSIAVKPRVRADEVKDKIESALHRSADLDAKKIHVEAEAGRVVISGTVRSWAEHEDAIHAAWSAPGVTAVDDHLAIRP